MASLLRSVVVFAALTLFIPMNMAVFLKYALARIG